MEIDSFKNKVFLSALLHHIPDGKAKEEYTKLLASSTAFFKTILDLADRYALTKKGEIINKFSYVGSPFENLKNTNKEETWKYDYKMPILPRSLTRDLFPSKDYNPDSNKISGLWNQFNEALNELDWSSDDRIKVTAERILSLMSKFAISIPNPSNINQEVSWYDYAKMKAGLAVCIYDYLKEEKKDLEYRIQDEDKPVLIIRADVSGIQSFIYDIASKQASKNLKGRSFYVQLLSESVLIKMLEAFHLYQCNVMYASGGNFFVIAPNTTTIKAAFLDFEHHITKAIFEEHGTRLSVVMGYQEIAQHEILDGTINVSIKKLFEEKISRNKKRSFSGLIQNNNIDFFKPFDEGGETATDIITGEEVTGNEKNIYKIEENSSLPQKATPEDINKGVNLIKEVTAKQIFLGHNLKDVKYLIVTPEILGLDPKKAEKLFVDPAKLGVNFYTVREKDFYIFEKALEGEANFTVFAINEIKDGGFFIGKKSTAYSSMFYGGNKAPVLKDDYEADGELRLRGLPKYFHELSGAGSFKRLAVLKMDVDGLGKIFMDVNPVSLTFSYYATLSRNLDWFFKGYLNTLWENNEDFQEYTQIIYSGGDDLFVIGRWDVVINFAETIYKEFADFTCAEKLEQNKRVTISGGVAVVTDKFPIMKAAAFADDAEKAAKRHELVWTKKKKEKRPQTEYFEFAKNSINLFGNSLHWDTEYLLVKGLKEELIKYVGSNENNKLKLPMSILGRIRMHHQMMKQYEIEKNKKNRVNPRWIWNVAYDFSRFKERQRKEVQDFIKRIKDHLDEDIKQYMAIKMTFLDKIQQGIFTNSYEDQDGNLRKIDSKYHFLELLNLAARWAELELRSKRK